MAQTNETLVFQEKVEGMGCIREFNIPLRIHAYEFAYYFVNLAHSFNLVNPKCTYVQIHAKRGMPGRVVQCILYHFIINKLIFELIVNDVNVFYYFGYKCEILGEKLRCESKAQ